MDEAAPSGGVEVGLWPEVRYLIHHIAFEEPEGTMSVLAKRGLKVYLWPRLG